ncbi:MAG: ABC transporter permease [Acidobacteria bacterium]|nr:ABC transporter permease [Acidobacteriota bacterium]
MKHDLNEAWRFLTANKGFAAVVVLTLGLAIGVNSTIFSVLNGVLLRPLDYAAPDRLVVAWENNQTLAQDRAQVSSATYLDWRNQTTTFESLAIWRYKGFTLKTDNDAERITTVDVSPVMFTVLGAAPVIGRVFTPNEEQPGSAKTVVLSHAAWTKRFGQDMSVLGRTLNLDDASYEIVGVMPREFQFPAGDAEVELWAPLTVNPAALASRPHRTYNSIGRLKPGATIEQAQADMDRIAATIAKDNPESNAGWGVTLVPAHEQVVGDIGNTLWVLFGAVVLVLVIACVNIANLLLARSARTAKEFAVRAAIGASQWALLRRSLVESGSLAGLGGLAGLLLAWWGIGALRPLIPANVPRADNIGLDWSVLAFTAITSIVAALIFGLFPAWRAMRPHLVEVFQDSGRGASASRSARRLSDAMVAAEVALALMLLVGAGLLIRSFVQLTSVDPGYRTSGIVAAHIVLPASRYGPSASKKQFFDDLVSRVKVMPGVESASAVSALPMSPLGVQFELPFTIDGLAEASPSERPRARYRAVMSGYFETMGIKLVDGRAFDDFDGRENGAKVAIVNELVAKRYFQGVSPLDKLVKIPMAGDLRIVGVVTDIKHDGLASSAEPEVFVPYFQFALSEMQVVVATTQPASAVATAIRSQMMQIDSALPIAKITTIEDRVSASVAQPRFNMTLLAGLALCAALLAALGVYGVVTYAVTRRTTEIGIRMALGADAGGTFQMVVLGAAKVVMVGVVLGLTGAALLGKSIESLLFGVATLDATTFIVAGLATITIGLLAAMVPALRATRIDPVAALRD